MHEPAQLQGNFDMSARAMGAELVGTFALVAVTGGAFMLAAPSGVGMLAPAIAAGVTMMAMFTALGHVSGGHFNPAITIGLIAAGRFESGNAIGYITAQIVGAVAAAAVLQVILANALAAGPVGNATWNNLAAISNTYGGARGFNITAAVAMEVLATALLLIVFVGATTKKGGSGSAPLAIGGALFVLTMLAMPVTNGALNPARATATAALAGGLAMSQLWIFWVAPIGGAILGGAIARWLLDE